MRIPALELRQQSRQVGIGIGIGNRLRKIVAGHGLAVEAFEVQRDAALEALAADQRLHHANDFCAFFVDRDRVEIADLDVAVGPHRVRHRAGVFRELRGAQDAHVFDALDRPGRRIGAQVLTEFLVAKDGEAFLQRELKPVAAGHAVARPVVEVLVADHAFDVAVVGIGGGRLVGQNVLRVEDVQALVLHRAHVEVAGRDDHEAVEVERQAEAHFVPQHRVDQRIHRVLGLVEVAGTHVHLQQMLLAVARGDALLARHQLAGDQGEQVGRFLERIDPLGEVAAFVARALQIALLDQVAVRQQHRVGVLAGAQRDGVARHHIGPVEKVRDAAKPLGLALREEGVFAHEQTHELGVLDRAAGREDLELECIGQGVDDQLVAFHAERGAVVVDQHACQVQLVAVQAQRLHRHVGVAAHPHAIEHASLVRVEIEGQLDRVDPVGGRDIVFAADGNRLALCVTQQHRESPENLNGRVRRSRARRR